MADSKTYVRVEHPWLKRRLVIEKAFELPQMDSSGMNDPYARVYWNGDLLGRTQVHNRNSNEQRAVYTHCQWLATEEEEEEEEEESLSCLTTILTTLLTTIPTLSAPAGDQEDKRANMEQGDDLRCT